MGEVVGCCELTRWAGLNKSGQRQRRKGVVDCLRCAVLYGKGGRGGAASAIGRAKVEQGGVWI